MPSERQPDPQQLEIRRFSPDEVVWATDLLENRLREGKALDPKAVHYNDERVRALERRIRTTILEVFREHSPEYRDHRDHGINQDSDRRIQIYSSLTEDGLQESFAKGIPRTITMLRGLIETVEERADLPSVEAAEPVRGRPPETSSNVFVVHGRSEGRRDTVARFIGQLGYTPVILQEQANEGRTIIEKFEHHSDAVAFAVVLFTGEDRGGLIDAEPSTYTPRARQNVILELGYFIGTLTRSRVCMLHEQGVEIPSDFHGVVYVPLDSAGSWKLLLAKEMKAAGLNVDLNRAL